MIRCLFVLAFLAFGVGCKQNPPSAQVPPAWSLNVWQFTSLPPVKLKTAAEGGQRPQPAFDAINTLLSPKEHSFSWDSDKQLVLDNLPAIYAFLDAAPGFASIKDCAIERPGDWVIDGNQTQISWMVMSGVARIIKSIVNNHEDLSNPSVRERVQNFALVLIALGTEVADVGTREKLFDGMANSERKALLIAGFELLGALDDADKGTRMTRPLKDIRLEVQAATEQEAARRTAKWSQPLK